MDALSAKRNHRERDRLRPQPSQGDVPEELSDEEKIAARLTRELAINHRVADALYHEAEQAFGTTGLFDIVALTGVYKTVCGALALFEGACA